MYSRVKEMIENYEKDEISFDELVGLITIHIGSRRSTIDTAMRTLRSTGLLEDIGNARFKIRKN